MITFDAQKYPTDKNEGGYLPWYEREFAGIRGPVALLELGIDKGGSLALWRDWFPGSVIVGIDRDPVPAAGCVTLACEQGNTAGVFGLALAAVAGGYDIIIDDCSHLRELTEKSLWALWPLLKPGGLYCIEDWGTGYYNDWPDGKPPGTADSPAGHTAGMVGLVKTLVDEAGHANLVHGLHGGHREHAGPNERSRFARMTVYPGIVFLEKAY